MDSLLNFRPTTFVLALRGLALASSLALATLMLTAQETPSEVATQPPTTNSQVEPGTGPRGRSFEDFKLIIDRNIFDPGRRARSRRTEVERPPEPRIDIVAFTGTLSYAKGTFAFFDSNATEFRKTAKVGDTVAGFTLKHIEQSQVALEHESRLLELRVGQQLRRQDEGAWEITTGESINHSGSRRTGSSGGRSTRSSSTSVEPPRRPGENEAEVEDSNQDTDEAAASTAESPGEGPSEVLKRLLEQRRKEQEQ